MIRQHFFLLFSFSLFLSSLSIAQTGTVRGFVYDESNGEPIIFTNVFLKGTTIGAATDVNGYYSISKVPPGNYTLSVTSLGYDTLELPIEVKKGDIITKKLVIKPTSIQIKEFEVSAERQEAQTQVKMSVTKITPKEIKQIPTVGGEPDLAQYLQVLPGVIFTGDQGGQLYIRGGSPIQNKVLLDGMIIYNPFHSIGLFSVFDTDIIRNADIYTGGFGAEYGGRISSIMDITTKDGNKNNLSGKLSLNTFGVKALVEGPLKKYTSASKGSSSFILSAKTSYLEQSSKALYTYIDTAGLPFNFTDLYGKVSFNGANGSKFNLFGFNFTDRVRYQAVSDLNWNTFGVGSNFVLVPGGSPVLIEGHFAYSQYDISLMEGALPPRSSAINGFNMGLDFKYFLGENEIKYGLEVLGFTTDFQFFNAVNRRINQEENTTELAGYVTYRLNAGNVVLEPGFRLHYYASLSEPSFEPRLGAKYNVTETFRLKAAAGLYSQNLIGANSDRDVVNLFYGFLSGSNDLPDQLIDEDGELQDITHALQKSGHLIVGAEYDLTERININVEAYYKDFSQLTNLNRNKIFDDTPDNFEQPDGLKKDFIIETGDARGVDFVLKYETKKVYLWAVYSLGKVTRWDGFQTYAPVFDRRHNVNLLASYAFGEDQVWEVNGRWNLGSGLPFTQTLGYYEQIQFDEGIGTDIIDENGDLGILYADLNGGRLPWYHRLDLTIKRKIEWSEKSVMEINAGVTNVYNRENIFYFDRVQNDRVDQLPILPSFGMSWTF